MTSDDQRRGTMGTIGGLHHAPITVPPGAEEAARRGYRDVLGLTELAKPASLAERWWAVGGKQ